jgi:hypothetical protein
MTGRTKLALVVAAVAVLAVAVGASGAVAVSRALDRDASEEVLADTAAELGVEPEELSDALRTALGKQIDEAVESGLLDEELADRLREGLDSGALPLLGGRLLHGPGFRPFAFPGHGLGLGHWKRAGLEQAASYLGLEEQELRERVRGGETLAEIAEDEGRSVDGLVDALVRSAQERIDEAVAAGRLDEEHAAELKEELEQRITDLVQGELRFHPHGPFGRGSGSRGGPPPFAGPRG